MIDLAPRIPGATQQPGYPPCPVCRAPLYPIASDPSRLGCNGCAVAYEATKRALKRAVACAKKDGIAPLAGMFLSASAKALARARLRGEWATEDDAG